MITVEDLISNMASSLHISLQVFDYRIVNSFSQQLRQGHSLTEKQGKLAIKIIKKYHKILSAHTGQDILNFVSHPVYKYPFRQPVNIKRISILNKKVDGIIGKVIKVEFPYSDQYLELIRNKKPNLGVAFWSKDEKAWLFSLCESNIKFCNYLILTENFKADEEFIEYSQQVIDIVNDLNKYVPMLALENGNLFYQNVSEFVPPLESKEILPAIFEARKRGITTWDDQIGKFIENYENTVISDFLVQEINEPFYLDPKKYDLSHLKEIILYLRPCIFVIPGGSEFEKFSLAYDFVKNCGISDQHISVLFRLPSDKGKHFNEYIKNFGLNNPIDEKTEIAFVSGKIPKPLVKSKLFFNSIINMGFDNPHYTSRNLVENHQNLIYYSEKPVQQRFLWQSLEL